MDLFGSISGKQVDEFAKALVQDILKHFPPLEAPAKARKSSQKKVASVIEGALQKAVAFKQQHKLGIYKTARLGNTFRWELKERGYDAEFVDTIVQDLVVRLSVK
jgi:hypothetical protein